MKIYAPTKHPDKKFRRRQNLGVNKISALTNLGIDKISWLQQNVGAGAEESPYCLDPLTVCPQLLTSLRPR
jgi:hypothetical protein